jgi:hypothetical protein
VYLKNAKIATISNSVSVTTSTRIVDAALIPGGVPMTGSEIAPVSQSGRG